jgi:polar amino acid transport system permease protein
VTSMFKEVPLLIGIGILDVVGRAEEAGNTFFRYVEPYTLAGLFFLLLSYPASLLTRRLERRVGSI